jgi:hypothetical protein
MKKITNFSSNSGCGGAATIAIVVVAIFTLMIALFFNFLCHMSVSVITGSTKSKEGRNDTLILLNTSNSLHLQKCILHDTPCLLITLKVNKILTNAFIGEQ